MWCHNCVAITAVMAPSKAKFRTLGQRGSRDCQARTAATASGLKYPVRASDSGLSTWSTHAGRPGSRKVGDIVARNIVLGRPAIIGGRTFLATRRKSHLLVPPFSL